MPVLVAQGPEPNQIWRKLLPSGQFVKLGRKVPESEWAVDWDKEISRLHAEICLQSGKLHVRRYENATNRIFYKGYANEDFFLAVGEQFVIGKTTFSLEEDPTAPSEDGPSPQGELTISPGELLDHRFLDAEDRIAILAKLPALIRFSPSDDEFQRRVVEALLAGIPRAQGAAVVSLNPKSSSSNPEVQVGAWAYRDGVGTVLRPSRRLVHDALRRQRRPVMHSWKTDLPEPDQQGNYTASGDIDWALCAPLPDEPLPGWALYVVGQSTGTALRLDPTGLHLQKSDLKFANLVADIYGALRQVRDMQQRLSVLQSILSPKVVAALGSQDIRAALEPRQTQVTVLFCDLRGSCLLAEEGAQDLQAACARLSEALSIMTRNILDKDGVIGDFQGDAAMGFWGWPQVREDQVEKAARAALAIRREFFQASQRAGHPLAGFACGIGIAHGPAIAGRLGTLDQIKVSVFGPVVNLASRLESLTKVFKVPILMDEAAANALFKLEENSAFRITSDDYRCRRVARILPFGMTRPATLYELLPPRTEAETLSERDHRDYEAALENFNTGNWDLARLLLDRLPGDGPSQTLSDFMGRHKGRPPKDWNGILVMDQK